MTRWKNPEEFKNRVKHWADKLDVRVGWLALRPMKNKWASCSTNGNLNFNSELLGLDRDVGEYVIVHELLHFVVPHHGKLWKSLMRAYLGDYETLDNKLKRRAARSMAGRKGLTSISRQ
jgi:predicted metal-dependent hydrolase